MCTYPIFLLFTYQIPRAMDDVGRENMRALSKAFTCSPSVLNFLTDPDILIPLQATTVDSPVEQLAAQFNINGIVIELNFLEKLKIQFSKLRLSLCRNPQLRNSWHIIKKHIDRTKYSSEGLEVLHRLRGIDLAELNDGFKLHVTAIPKSPYGMEKVFSTFGYLSFNTIELINAMLMNFIESLRALPPEQLCRPSLQKIILQNKGYMKVLPQDQEFLLRTLDQSKDLLPEHETLDLHFYVYKFGHRSQEPLILSDITDFDNIVRLSLHVACTLSTEDPHTLLFWSRAGLEKLVGPRTTVYSAMSMHECANMQTELDEHEVDVSPVLGSIADLLFANHWQFYMDSPHTHALATFRHPVSGLIVIGGLGHPNYTKALESRAQDYYVHMRDLANKAMCKYPLRIEMVQALDAADLSCLIEPILAVHFFSLRHLKWFLNELPMVIPFKWDEGDCSVQEILCTCLTYMADELWTLGNEHSGKGGFIPSWRAFQLELALEEAFYGHPLSNVDNVYSSAMGTSSRHEFSATHIRGFMALGSATAPTSEDTPPPVLHWTKDALQTHRIHRLFSLTCNMEAEPSVVGPSLVVLLLQDLFGRNEEIPISALQGDKCPDILKGHVNLSTLVGNLATRDTFPTPFTFSRARILIQEAGKDVYECLMAGFLQLKLRWFPEIKYRDVRGTTTASWNFQHFIEVHNDHHEPSMEARASAMVGDIAMEMERRSMCYGRKLERYQEHGMPWLADVLKRIPGTVPVQTQKNILILASSIGMLMNGDYVSFENIKDLLIEKNISQSELQKYKILSTSPCERTSGFTFYKLHYDIPYKMLHRPFLPDQKMRPTVQLDMEELKAPLLLEDEVPESVVTRAVYMPANVRRDWTPEETGFVNPDSAVPVLDGYRSYVQQCKAAAMAARSYQAYVQKRREILFRNL